MKKLLRKIVSLKILSGLELFNFKVTNKIILIFRISLLLVLAIRKIHRYGSHIRMKFNLRGYRRPNFNKQN